LFSTAEVNNLHKSSKGGIIYLFRVNCFCCYFSDRTVGEIVEIGTVCTGGIITPAVCFIA
jgi:hypothetical protein